MLILIIEDDALLAMKLQQLVEDLGASSSLVATSRAQAVARARRYPPDIIIADLHLDDGHGVEAVRSIKSAGSAAPVVYVTGDPAEARRLDPEALILSKPLRERELIAALARLRPFFSASNTSAQTLPSPLRPREPGQDRGPGFDREDASPG